jgi:putative membrane protein
MLERLIFSAKHVQPGTVKFLRFLQGWIINTFAVLVAVAVLHGHIRYGRPVDLLLASLFLGILNAFVRPILLFFALPLLIFTLGLFTFVINALMLYGVGWMMGLLGLQFTVDSFWSAFLGALIISIVSIALNILTGAGGARVTVHRRSRPPGDRHDDGNGPVIDV